MITIINKNFRSLRWPANLSTKIPLKKGTIIFGKKTIFINKLYSLKFRLRLFISWTWTMAGHSIIKITPISIKHYSVSIQCFNDLQFD